MTERHTSNLVALQNLLTTYRTHARTEREKGSYFEQLTKIFLENDAAYKNMFSKVYSYADWAREQGISNQDTGIDLVAETTENDVHAIQCKFYDAHYRIQKTDLHSFFTASGKSQFTNRLFVDSTTGEWSKHAEDAMDGQQIPVQRLTISDMAESNIDWSQYADDKPITFIKPKTVKAHQTEAIEKVKKAFQTTDRGKLIMACGSGKTLTSLKIAECTAGAGTCVLYLVPSLALISQTVRAWANDKSIDITSFAVCSDSKVGKHDSNNEWDISIHDLAYPATTNAEKLAQKVAEVNEEKMTVIFSTYQSIDVIIEAQQTHHMNEFALVICDEAHRTTGATVSGDEESCFLKVHDSQYLKAKKRLYMTATPRIYSREVKDKAKETDALIASMDDPKIFGNVLYEVTFNYAVEQELLSDYKVIVLALDEGSVDASLQKLLRTDDFDLNIEDTTKIIGCYKALSKIGLKQDTITDTTPMHRAVAFCKDIRTSNNITLRFSDVIREYIEQVGDNTLTPIECQLKHIDGTFNAKKRKVELDWLKENSSSDDGDDVCKILTNVRCLSEGVDVPTLDAVMFLHPRKSQVDVVQSVGRVMRKAPNKKMGYVILPVTIATGIEPEEALKNNKKYEVVWQVLNALRSHDERLDSTINRASLGDNVESKIEIIAVSNILPQKPKTQKNIGIGSDVQSDNETNIQAPIPHNDTLDFGDTVNQAIMAKLVKKCGTRAYWEDWATDVADIAKKHIERISAIVSSGEARIKQDFKDFVKELQETLNPSVSEDDAIEMLSSHIITLPVFDALFEGYEFTKNNAVSQAMQKMVHTLQNHSLQTKSETLEAFYASVKRRVEGIQSIKAKQAIIVELYDTFFKRAFPRVAQALGIVYTPVPVVDFIIHSINHILQNEFHSTLGSRNVNIIDPFTGTGTFITRLLQSGLIRPQELPYKYANEIHANEIVLLSYYIASINIEQVYHEVSKEMHYTSFEGICLTDTFQMYESDNKIKEGFMPNNSRRVTRQKQKDIRVIMGNPPYSAGQRAANDNNQNVKYPKIDARIEQSYAKHSTATNKNSLYDSYIRAIKWGSERLDNKGVMGFITNANFIDGNALAGLRKCLSEEYTTMYVLNLRGNIRKNIQTRGEAGEGGNIFDVQVPVAITLFVKNPQAKERGRIHYYETGDGLTKEAKLHALERAKSIKHIGWQRITPNKHYDWIALRDDAFYNHIAIGEKETKGKAHTQAIFNNYSRGLSTCRDVWVYNSSTEVLTQNIQTTIDFYNSEVQRYHNLDQETKHKASIRDLLNMDSTKISWERENLKDVEKGKHYSLEPASFVQAIYRPFCKQWAYYHKDLNSMTYQLPKIFPMGTTLPNMCICVSCIGESSFGIYIVDALPDLHTIGTSQCFPRYLYEENKDERQQSLKNELNDKYIQQECITDYALQHFAYEHKPISKEDIFYYVYGILHSPQYRKQWKHNLLKSLPHIPKVKEHADFLTFSRAGRALAELHLNYECVPMYPADIHYKHGEAGADYRVTEMKFDKANNSKNRSTIIYNESISIHNIPDQAYKYTVGNKSAIEWVMNRQRVKTDKNSGITNDANIYATETMDNAKYPLELLLRIITVSERSIKIIEALPDIVT